MACVCATSAPTSMWGEVCPTSSRRGQRDPEDRAFAGPTLDANGAAVVLDDAVTHGEAETRAFPRLLRREERLEDLLPHVLGDAGARVLEHDLALAARVSRRDLERTAVAHRLA